MIPIAIRSMVNKTSVGRPVRPVVKSSPAGERNPLVFRCQPLSTEWRDLQSSRVLALRAAYVTGRITSGGADLANHLKYDSFPSRERLRRANDPVANGVLPLTGEKSPRGFESYLFARMDEWLTALAGR